jgi:aminoglycoside phosphotransferase
VQAKWRERLKMDRQKRGSPSSFVLTHADLTWNSIMVAKDDTSGKYVITGLIDWDCSGFLPDYVEYAVLSVISFHTKAWLKVLKAAVPKGDCSRDRLAFTRVMQRACNPLAGGMF